MPPLPNVIDRHLKWRFLHGRDYTKHFAMSQILHEK